MQKYKLWIKHKPGDGGCGYERFTMEVLEDVLDGYQVGSLSHGVNTL